MIVLDSSIVMAYCMADEENAIADAAMLLAVEQGGVVPALMWYEIRNILIVSERRGRLTAVGTTDILHDIHALALEVDHAHDEGVVLELARHHELSVYDAAYLEVAQRRGLALATLDKKLRKATLAIGAEFGRDKRAGEAGQ